MTYLQEDEVLGIRKAMTRMDIASRDFGGQAPLYPDRVSSAVARQWVGFSGQLKYTKVESVGATLFFGLTCNHGFDNGNKRTALVSLLVFLAKNRIALSGVSETDLYELATEVADCKMSGRFYGREPDEIVDDVARWIRANTQTNRAGYRPMKMGDFLKSLRQLGCTVGPPDRSFVKITPPEGSPGQVASMAYAGEGREVSADYVKQIRNKLGLTLREGVHEAAFFELEPAVDHFVSQHAQVLEWLADA